MAFVSRRVEKMSGGAHRLRYGALHPAGDVRCRSLTTRLLPVRDDQPHVRLYRPGATYPACLSLLDDTQGVPRPQVICVRVGRHDLSSPEVPSLRCRALATAGTRWRGAVIHGQHVCGARLGSSVMSTPLRSHALAEARCSYWHIGGGQEVAIAVREVSMGRNAWRSVVGGVPR
jgi:hypothetical protein